MPKIATKKILLDVEGKRIIYCVDIMYSTDNANFYAVIPKDINDQFDLLTEKGMSDLSAKKMYRSKYNLNGEFKRIIHAQSEAGCLDMTEKAIKYLLKLNIAKRQVIVLKTDLEKSTWDNLTNPPHYWPQNMLLRFGFAFQYCEETKVGTTSIYKNWNRSDPQHNYYYEVTLDKEDDIVIDDTPENRQFLETLYKNMFELNKKLIEFTATPEKLLELINSNQKLLN